MNTSNPFSSAHRDVLDAVIPDGIQEKERLLDELKSRGKLAVQATNWPDASMLYRKALEVCKAMNDDTIDSKKEIAILSSNLALTEAKMNLWDMSRKAALDATCADDTYVKGWYRLSQAQYHFKNYTDAIVSIEKAIQFEPKNMALQKELTKIKKEAANATSDSNKEPSSSTSTIAAPPKKVQSTTTKTVTSSTKNDTNTSGMNVDGDGNEFTKSDHVKGYKIVNGKKTSYFHNELSDDVKQLIGDIAPKKLEDPTAAVSAAAGDSTKSVWNQAGTWEEKDVTTWSNEAMEKLVLQSKYTLPVSSPAPNALVTVTKVTIVSGHASIAAVRNKKRYIYEYNIKVHWKFVHNINDSTTTTAEGTMDFPDIDGTCIVGEPYDATNFTVTKISDTSIRNVLQTFIYQQGFRTALHESIDQWVRTFQETY